MSEHVAELEALPRGLVLDGELAHVGAVSAAGEAVAVTARHAGAQP
jgi:hypothetical protein